MSRQRLSALAAALWWGSLTAVGLVMVPVLFAKVPHVATAAQVAAHLFTAQTWISIACTVAILVLSRAKGSETLDAWAQAAMGFAIAGLLLALLQEYGATPKILARQNLALWHTLGGALYLGQWLCALLTLWRVQSR